MRKDADFSLDDHIALTYQASDKLARALTSFGDYLRAETLADKINVSAPTDGQTFEFDGETLTLAIAKV